MHKTHKKRSKWKVTFRFSCKLFNFFGSLKLEHSIALKKANNRNKTKCNFISNNKKADHGITKNVASSETLMLRDSCKSPWNVCPTSVVYKTFKTDKKLQVANNDLMKLLMPENFMVWYMDKDMVFIL